MISTPWTVEGEHINALELRGYLLALKWRSRSAQQVGRRFLHYLDSQVAHGAMAKGRTASWKLRPIVLRINAYVLGGCFWPMTAFCRSHRNPADAPSRAPSRRLPVKRPDRKGRTNKW